MTHDIDRNTGGTPATMVRERDTAVARRERPELVRWVEFLAFLTLLAAAAVVLSFVVDDSPDIAEVRPEAAITIAEFAALEDAVQPAGAPIIEPVSSVFSASFHQLAETVGVTLGDTSLTPAELQDLKDFALLEDTVLIP